MEAIIFSGANLALVSAYDGVDHNQWNETVGPVVALRKAIRDHYLVQQDYRCAYCRVRKLETHGLVWDIEHILPKSLYPRHLYAPLNLALACKECNIAKDDQEVLKSGVRTRLTLSVNPDDYLIVHPHFDTYSDHIRFSQLEGKTLFFPKSSKGERTIYMCSLLRYSYQFGGWDNFDEALVQKFSNFLDRCPPDASVHEVKTAVRHVVTDERGDF